MKQGIIFSLFTQWLLSKKKKKTVYINTLQKKKRCSVYMQDKVLY